MKHIMAAFLFLVTWSEYDLNPNCNKSMNIPVGKTITTIEILSTECVYTVETVDKSIKLKTQKDVDLFVGEEHVIYHDYNNGVRAIEQLTRKIGIIGPNAFNIKVKEIEK